MFEPGPKIVIDVASFDWDGAFERQIALVKEQQALDARLANLVQANEDARVFSAEGN